MKLAIMQPYLFPYLGYFQLLAAVDRFVVYDDVAYIKSGWINRNRWLVNNEAAYFTIPVQGASSFRSIAEVGIVPGNHWQRKLLETFRQCYGNAPYYARAAELLAEVVNSPATSIGKRALASVRLVAEYLEIRTTIVETSQVYNNAQLKAAPRVLDICRREGATTYVNAIGGQELYESEEFRRAGVELRFLHQRPITYSQFRTPFVPALSILDVIAFNSAAEICDLLHEYDLL